MNKHKFILLSIIIITFLFTNVNTYAETIDTIQMSKDRYEIEETKEIKKEYLGLFTITHYCGCKACNGKWTGYPCFNGEYPKAHYTIAVDQNIIPLDTFVQIDGYDYTYKAQDTGSKIKGNRIDVYCDDHQLCLTLGIRYNVPVYKIIE